MYRRISECQRPWSVPVCFLLRVSPVAFTPDVITPTSDPKHMRAGGIASEPSNKTMQASRQTGVARQYITGWSVNQWLRLEAGCPTLGAACDAPLVLRGGLHCPRLPALLCDAALGGPWGRAAHLFGCRSCRPNSSVSRLRQCFQRNIFCVFRYADQVFENVNIGYAPLVSLHFRI